jgi:serine phosphatase RsbU (regulator of sigma subunit)/anti-sigma regulatory factor (Ser/Thr protein kinase)
MCLVNAKLLVERLNTPLTKLISKNYSSCLNEHIQDIFLGWDEHIFVHNINLVLETGMLIRLDEHPFIRESSTNWYEISFHPVKDDSQKTIKCILSLKNVTESYMTKKMLVQQYKRLETTQNKLEENNSILQATQNSLDLAYQSLVEEVNVARDVQQSILPEKISHIGGVDFFVSYSPIKQVGGDLYEILNLSKDHIGVFIGDVSGHGLASAFVGAMVKMALIDHMPKCFSPKDLFSKINHNMLKHANSGHYLTAFYGIIDQTTNMFLYSKASHPPPILIRANGDLVPLSTGGMFVGLMEEPLYEEKSIHLEKGDRLYFFTDGYFELKNTEGQHFLYEDLQKLIHSVNHLSKEDAHQEILETLYAFTGSQTLEDDHTFLIVDITKEAESPLQSLTPLFPVQDTLIHRIFYTKKDFEGVFKELEGFLEKHVLSREKQHAFRLSALELANNALEHGHKGDSSKAIGIAYGLTNDQVKLVIRDQGEGFSPNTLPDICLPENIQSVRGRGVHITRSYMDEVHYNKKGNQVTITMDVS